MIPTREAMQCRAWIEIDSGQGLEKFDDAIFVGLIHPVQHIDLLAGDDRIWIPIYLQPVGRIPHPLFPAFSLEPGIYVTGARFILRNIPERLDPGKYEIKIFVIHPPNKEPVTWKRTLEVS